MAVAPTFKSGRTPKSGTECLDITVLAGGPGSERDVSLESGRAVHDALVRLGHRAELHDIGPKNLTALARDADIVFIALHGEFGEDGTVQAELESRKLPYTGSGSSASRLAIDKVAAKRCFVRAGIPTPDYEVVDARSLSGLGSRFVLPAVVKPVSSGSSVDINIARTADRLDQAASDVVAKYGQALVETYIGGPELTVSVLGNQALPVCEIRTPREFYDYHAKYLDDRTEYLFDLELPRELLERVQSFSLAAHAALGCEAFSRVDWMVDRVTGEPYVLEVNTIPGFTSHSLLPKAAARTGMSFDQLCRRIIDLSLTLRRA